MSPTDRAHERSITPVRKSGKARDPSQHARFSLHAISDVLRGKSKTRDTSNRRSSISEDAGGRSVSRGRSKGLKALREALVAGMNENGAVEEQLDSDEEGLEDNGPKVVGWRDFKVFSCSSSASLLM